LSAATDFALNFGVDRSLKEDNKMNSRTCRFLRRSALAAAIAGISAPASAAFIALAEQSASGIGTAFAGGAASADDASTIWFNPAGMTRLNKPEFVFAGHYIDLNIKTNVISATTTNFGAPGTGVPISGGAGKDPGTSAFIPNIYYSQPLTKDFWVGAGVNVPFGLKTEYDSTWAGRYHAVESDINSVNFNVSGAYKFNDVLSGGVGVNYQTFKATLSQAVDFATICIISAVGACAGTGGGTNDGFAKVTADSNAWGYNLGLLAQLPNDFRLGVSYRSTMKQSLSGNSAITAPANAAGVAAALRLVDSGAKADVTLPSSFSISAYQQLGPQWAFMADITRTNWSSLPELRIKFDSGAPDSVVTLNLINTWRTSVGATYKPNDAWILRAGFAYDQSPVTDPQFRTPRLPDADRTWYAIGAGLKATPSLSFDFGYVLIKVDQAQVRKTSAPSLANENALRGNLSVDYTGTIQVLSAQGRWVF
jgi:long-chain fatty acid transport protein